MEASVFYIAATITILSIVMMIVQKNPVASAIHLVISFFALAVIYVTLSAHFVAALQILVYAGAIMVLFVFVIMLLNLKDSELTYDRMTVGKTLIGIFGFSFFVLLAWHIRKIPVQYFKPVAEDFGSALRMGEELMTTYVVPFEMLGILLLVGLVGAIVLGRRDP